MQHRSHAQRHPATFVAAMLAVSVLAACGGRLSDRQVLDANGVSLGQASGAQAPDGGTVDPGATGVTPGAKVQPGPAGSVPVPGALQVPGKNASSAGPAANPVGPGAKPTAGAGALTTKETGPILIGSVGTNSGLAGATEGGGITSLQVWAANLNSNGGLFGRQVKLIINDDGGSPQTHLSQVRDLVENQRVIAFVYNGALTTSATSYLKQKGIPTVPRCDDPSNYTESIYFPMCSGDNYGAILKLGKQITGKLNVGLLYCVETPTCKDAADKVEAAAPGLGMKAVYKASISLSSVDYTSNCQAARSAGAELIEFSGDSNTLKRLATSCSRQQYFPQFLIPSGVATHDALKTDGLKNVLIANFVFPFEGVKGNAAIDEFHRLFSTLAPKTMPAAQEASGWASVKLLEYGMTLAVKKTGSLNSATILSAMRSIKGETLGGLTTRLDFTSGKSNNGPCVSANQAKNGVWTAPFNATFICK